MYKINLTICAAISTLFFVFSTDASGQEITPSVVHASGGSSVVNEVTVEWNVGDGVAGALSNSIIKSNDCAQLQPLYSVIRIDKMIATCFRIYPLTERLNLPLASTESLNLIRKYYSKCMLIPEEKMPQQNECISS